MFPLVMLLTLGWGCLQACIPAGDLDLGYQLRSNFFGGSAFLMLNHGSQDVPTSTAPVSNIYSAGKLSSSCPRL